LFDVKWAIELIKLTIMKTLFAFSLCIVAIVALVFDAPLATPVWGGFEIQKGLIPNPTPAPSMEEFAKRQVPGLIVAPDGTCGFISGSSGIP
jgi:hypothetical protein